MRDQEADRIGPSRGGEYFVKLSLIEIVEQKIGYESGVESLEESKPLDYESSLSSVSSEESLKQSRKRKRDMSNYDEPSSKKTKNHDDNNQLKNKDNFVMVREHLVRSKKKQKDKDVDSNEESYVIDAKRRGNVGRFLNHSCDPNCFLQNIFSDTHDPRFPILAFFTMKPVKALQELTWDYYYEDDDDVFECNCGSINCRSLNSTVNEEKKS